MDRWDVRELLLERGAETSEAKSEPLTCRRISWNPETNISTERTSQRGHLLAEGCDTTTLTQLSWEPTRLQFKVRRFMEPRIFEIEGFEVMEDGRVCFWLPSASAGGAETGGSDGHIGGFPPFSED